MKDFGLARTFSIALGFFIVAVAAKAQPLPVNDILNNDYLRVLQVSGTSDSRSSFSVRPVGTGCPTTVGAHPWEENLECPERPSDDILRYGLVSPEADMYLNSDRPFGRNDGAVWQGNGMTGTISAGAWVWLPYLSAMLRPRVIYTHNAHFDLSRLPIARNQSIYSYPYRNNIDWPQRFGSEPWTEVVLDGSFLQAHYGGIAAGISKENMWWGPSIQNSIVMSNNAAGLRHVFLRTNDPVDSPIGAFEGRWIWANLTHSDYFIDASYSPDREIRGSEDNDRFMTAITLNWNPVWVPGLYVGAAQSLMLHYSVEKRFLRDYLGVVNPPFLTLGPSRRKGVDDKVVSLYGRWVHPESGVEVYGEWARGDHTSTVRDFFVEPDHSRAWTLGLQKIFKPAARIWTRTIVELTNLEKTRESGHRVNRGSYFYTHESVRQGYTHEGQLIGAAIGPGSSSQNIQFDIFAPFGKVGIHLLRMTHDNDRYFIYHLPEGDRGWNYEVEMGGGLSGLVFISDFEFQGSVTYTRILNKDHISGNDVPNWNIHLAIRRQLMGLR